MNNRIADYQRQFLIDDGEYDGQRYIGVVSARVTNNNDPDKCGRVEVVIPQISGDSAHPRWAWPCGVMLTPNVGYGSLFLPEVGDWVQVEFENGNPNYPLWRSGWWASGDLPDDLKTNYPKRRGFVTVSGHQLIFDDSTGADSKIILKHASGHTITLSGTTPEVVIKTSGKIVLDAALIEAVAEAVEKAMLGTTFTADLASALTTLMTALAAGTEGSPVAQILVGLTAATPLIEEFITKLTSGGPPYLSEKVTIG